jgi:hypothetical protein
MRTKKYPATQKFRVVIETVHISNVTAKTIRNGIGDCTLTNRALQFALLDLEYDRTVRKNLYGQDTESSGLAGRWLDRNVQLDVM